MQLVAYGAQDIYLTGNPQITFFKVVYRRHTNFSMESIRQTGSGGGGQATWTIARNGDLILDMYLEKMWLCSDPNDIKTANYFNSGTSGAKGYGYFNDFENEVANRLFVNSKVDTIRYNLEIGGQTVDKFDNLYRRSVNSLSDPNPTNDDQTLLQRMEDAGIYNLPFWFCKNPGSALPLIALQYHEVKLIVEFNDVNSSNYIKWGSAKSTALEDFSSDKVELWVDYVYLDTEERRRFAQVSHEYLIEQVQVNKSQISSATSTVELTFNHPVKELMWVMLSPKNIPTMHSFNKLDSKDTSCQLVLNGQDRFAKRVAKYFSTVQVCDYHSGYGSLVSGDFQGDAVADGQQTKNNSIYLGAETQTTIYDRPVYVYSFALKPEEHQPSGTCNFSRIDSASLLLEGIQTSAASISSHTLSNGYYKANDTGSVPGTLYPCEVSSINVYAVNYNVLRIMSGMGGLAYSN